jgi:phosphohistidine phosphatase SixA
MKIVGFGVGLVMKQHLAAPGSLVLIMSLLFSSMASAETDAWEALRDGRAVAMIRHALAPGTGDPAAFVIGDCFTQRNLSAAGRDQARRLGDLFRDNGMDKAFVYSSQWCRCLETARLMALGPVEELPALNSFFADRSQEPESVRGMKDFFSRSTNEAPVVLVTHQVNITAITGIFPRSGEIVVVDRQDFSVMHREVVR